MLEHAASSVVAEALSNQHGENTRFVERDGGQVAFSLLRQPAGVFEALDEHEVALQALAGNRFMGAFEKQLAEWKRRLIAVRAVLGLLLQVQRAWSSLEDLYLGSDVIRAQLPEETKRFDQIDAEFVEQMVAVQRMASETSIPGVLGSDPIAVCTVEGREEALSRMKDGLEVCQKGLSDLCESTRLRFPRLYFLSQAMLLRFIVYSDQPSVVLKDVQTVFEGVKEVELSGEPAVHVEALVSREGERVVMCETERIRLHGHVADYLGAMNDAMRAELRAQLRKAIQDYDVTGKGGRCRPAWLPGHVAQLALVTTQQQWTMRTEIALQEMSSGTNGNALRNYYAFQLEMLADMIKMVQGEMPKLVRRAAMNVVTFDAHTRDINAKMVRIGVDRVDHFEWFGQPKFKWEYHKGHGGATPAIDSGEELDAVLYHCDALFRYSFEYLGCAGRLVITPLTDRIYITATQSAHLILGCALQGPPGTGKTETTKDLSAQLGKAVCLFNCGPHVDYRTMGDIFKGLASSGSWVCFDEFNRLTAGVLSVCTMQFKSVLDGIKLGGSSFRFDGKETFLHRDGCMALITMNTRDDRQELPDSLKVLFRPVTVIVPDIQLIIENMMMAEGYTTAAKLAKKIFTLYNLAGDLLGGNPKRTGKQLHYDWGLRAIGSVLKVAGGLLRPGGLLHAREKAKLLEKGMSIEDLEDGLLMRALRDFTLPKVGGGDDAIVFTGLLRDLFADVFDLMPRARDYDFEALVKEVAVEEDTSRFPPKLQAGDYFVQNVVDLQDVLAQRHCVFVIGPSGCNKSVVWKILSKCWTKGGVMGKTIYKDINPKSITPNELYGYIDMATREWKDGLLSSFMRDMANAPDSNPKWIVLDGDLDANWVENMNSVMDDSRLLTLGSNERIRLLQNMKMLFEIRDLTYTSPATVTRAGVLFISDEQQWKQYVQSWIEFWIAGLPFQVKPNTRKELQEKAEALFEKYVPAVLLELKMYYLHIVNLLDFGMVQSLLNMLQGLWITDNIGTKDAASLEVYFVFAAVWAFGGAMSITSGVDYRKKFSSYWKDTWKAVKFPHRGEVFDVYVDRAKKDFVSWTEVVPELAFDSATQKMSLVTVPTGETVAVAFWLANLLPNKHPSILIGAAGCGKTALINGKLRSLPEEYSSVTVNINYYTNATMYQKALEAPLEKKAGQNFGPPGNKKLIYFVDDLNMAALDKYNTASNISLMRQHMGYGHIYDRATLSQKVLLNTQYLAAMNPTVGSFIVNPRLQRLFSTFAIGFPSTEALNTIFATFLRGHLSKFNDEVQGLGKRLVQAALQLHKRVAATFRKTAANFHYEFNVRHVACVFQGMLMGQPAQLQDPLKMTQLWLHESERTYGDRLVSINDLRTYKDLAVEQAEKYFKEMSPPVLFAEPLIFSHFAQGVGDKIYDRIATFGDLSGLLNGALEEYNETNAAMNLVLFEDAMRHVCRISRIIESAGGHALMVGVGCMGKQSLARLATFVNGYSAFQVVITSRYSVNDLKADLQFMYRKSGLKGEGVSFIFTDQQIADERFLIFMNDLLSSCNIPGLFPVEEMDTIINAVRPIVKRAGLPDNRENCWDMFINTVRENLHVILCFSPVGDPIKVRTRRFPALVNCVVIDWFQPWPEEALTSVSKKFLDDVDLGSAQTKENALGRPLEAAFGLRVVRASAAQIINFMPYSFLKVNDLSMLYEQQERRFNYTTPKSFLELIALYKSMLANRRAGVKKQVKKLRDGVIKLENTADSVAELEDVIKQKTVEVEAKKAEVDEKAAVMAEAERLERKLRLAQRLMTALSSEGARWKESIKELEASLEILVGDVLLASAFVSYIGCFNKRFRKELMDVTFALYLSGKLPQAKGGVPMTDSTDPVKILTTDAQIAGWNTEMLPADRVSTENGAIVTNCARWPVLIDPQLQGVRWIKKHEEKRQLKVVRLGQKTLLTNLSLGIEQGIPVLIENIQLQIDAVLNPVIGRQTIKRGRNFVIKLGDKEVDYSPQFKLYIQTKLSNPHYPPEIQAETTLVNFMVTEDGLEDQLLATVVLLERPDLGKEKEDLIAQQNQFKVKLAELEDGILEQLATAEGDVTENIALIENLEMSKATSIEVAEKMVIAKQTQVTIEEASEQYRPVANRGSLMFFLLSDLFKVHTFHFYSLNSFDLVYQRAIAGREAIMKKAAEEQAAVNGEDGEAAAPAEPEPEPEPEKAPEEEDTRDPSEILQYRLKYLVENVTYEVYDYCRRGLFERHKLIVSTMLMLRILQRQNAATPGQVNYLIMGTKVASPPQMTAKVQEYLTSVQWSAVCALKDVDPYQGLTEDLELNVDNWREWLNYPNPEVQDLSDDWQKRISPFAKLLLVRALRPDRVTAALTLFISDTMGSRYMVQKHFSLEKTFPDSSSQTPLFFVLFPGVDPGEEIERLGTKLGFTEEKGNYVSISMGQGQERNGENVLDRFTLDGGWAFLQNVHLMQAWLPTLERKLEIAQETGHPDFRCFVTAEPPALPDQLLIPEGIMQSSIKVANEPPTDVKSLYRSAYALFSQEQLDKSGHPVQFKPMLFALSFFHSICLGRRKFSGFSHPYAWNNGDLIVCGAILHNYLEANEHTPWANVRYLFGEVMYGGHITNPWDRRITSTYLDVLLNPDLIDEKSSYEMAPGFKPLLEGDYKDYRQYIEDRLPAESPVLFGMHPNAEISLLNSLAEGLFFSILSVSGGGGGAGGVSKEEQVSAVLTNILEQLREEFNVVEIRMRIKEKGSPYVVFLLQELERMNKICTQIRSRLNELALGLSGALNISDAMDALITALFMNQVPPVWLKTCGQIGPTGTYNRKSLSNWYEDLKLRWAQLEDWSAPTKPLEALPPSVWISGCFNPMGLVTASMQVTARINQFSLDQMRVHVEVTDVMDTSGVESQPADGVHIHGLFMENARWSCEEPCIPDELEEGLGITEVGPGSIVDSKPKELYPVMPMIHLTARTADKAFDSLDVMRKSKGRYICPFYTTTVRGPTFVFAGPVRTSVKAEKWILAGAALLMQPD